jgi:predicted Ser/Thr protein kinase
MLIEGQKIGPFSIVREIGTGAMGAVYLATYTKTGQKVAIKVIAPGLGDNEKIMARFEREAEMLKQLKHPNIVKLLGTGKYHRAPFYAMEFIDGESLGQMLDKKGKFDWQEVVEFGKQVCSALYHAHANGIIHRDLKPSNLMMTRKGTIKLTDFGIAKDMDASGLTSAHCTVGTAAYMSPEQCRGERDLTPKSDLYSLGILFYEMLTGKKPFFAENAMDMFMAHVSGKFKRPGELVLDIPRWLDTLVCQLLEKKPEHRPLDAKMVGEALDEVRLKVSKQKSVAVEEARKTVRITGGDTLDRKAAATLVAGRKAKKTLEKRRMERREKLLWASGLGFALLIVLALIVYVALPAGPSALLDKAERYIRSGDSRFAGGDSDAWFEWDHAEEILRQVENRFPDTPAAATAKERREYVKAGKLYLSGNRWMTDKKKDWEAAKKKGYDELIDQYAAVGPFAEKALKELQEFEAPKLLESAERDADPNGDKAWKSAAASLAMLLKRYPKSDQATQGRDLLARLTAHQEALAKIVKSEQSQQAWPRPTNPAEDLVLQALAAERAREMEKAKELWQKVKTWGDQQSRDGGPQKENPANKPWVALAEAKLAAWR